MPKPVVVAAICVIWSLYGAAAWSGEPIKLSYPYLEGAEKSAPKVRALAERVSQAYMHLEIIYPGDPANDVERGVLQKASAIIIDAEGHLVTAAHIARSTANEARATARDGSSHDAKILHLDKRQDLALLKIKPFKGMQPARLADTGTLKRGDFAIAVGSPNRARGAVTVGFVRVPRLKEKLAYNRWAIEHAIEIKMLVESGHSGGPVFNQAGALIGMVAGHELGDTTKKTYVSPAITYAIPSDELKAFLKRARGR